MTSKSQAQVKSYLTQADYYAEYVRGEPDSKRLITIFNAFRQEQYEKKKNEADTIPFGKYKNKNIENIATFDRSYLIWLAKQKSMEGYPALLANIRNCLDGDKIKSKDLNSMVDSMRDTTKYTTRSKDEIEYDG